MPRPFKAVLLNAPYGPVDVCYSYRYSGAHTLVAPCLKASYMWRCLAFFLPLLQDDGIRPVSGRNGFQSSRETMFLCPFKHTRIRIFMFQFYLTKLYESHALHSVQFWWCKLEVAKYPSLYYSCKTSRKSESANKESSCPALHIALLHQS
jgi:hypothetical protein